MSFLLVITRWYTLHRCGYNLDAMACMLEWDRCRHGTLRLTDDPGFGIDIDWKLVERWRI